MDKNGEDLPKAGVKYIAPFEKIRNIKGRYNYDILFLSEWPSEEVFLDIHDKDDFVDLVNKTRNKAFKAFTDSKGVIR